ncbi:unnamed protein product, partial [Tetraodon nigroviridis]
CTTTEETHLCEVEATGSTMPSFVTRKTTAPEHWASTFKPSLKVMEEPKGGPGATQRGNLAIKHNPQQRRSKSRASDQGWGTFHFRSRTMVLLGFLGRAVKSREERGKDGKEGKDGTGPWLSKRTGQLLSWDRANREPQLRVCVPKRKKRGKTDPEINGRPTGRNKGDGERKLMKLDLCQALTFALLLAAPACLSTPPSAWISPWGPSADSPGRPVRARRQLHFRNEWSAWSGWSVCSRSCGSGASVRTRTCITRNPVGAPCAGDPRQYKICNTKECPPSSEDFREMQCAAFNDRPLVAGNSFKWTTFDGGERSNPCELSCLALGHNFYYNFGRVLDGTSCNKEPGGVCVNGRCLKPGCDAILGSQQQEDACMVCGGQNSTCMHHKSVYQSNSLQAGGPFGYSEVAMIPAGATHIRVTDNSRNYLALQNGRSQFVINGDWKISIPGEYSIAGTKLLYRRSADTWESFEVPGPTREDLHLMVLATDRNPDIQYEYWLPPEQYALYHGRKSPLRQAHHTSYLPWDQPDSLEAGEAATPVPPASTPAGAGEPQEPPSPTCTWKELWQMSASSRPIRTQEAVLPEGLCFPRQNSGEGVQRRGDPLRRAGDPHLPEQLPPGAPGVPLGPQPVRLSPPGDGEAVHPDGASSHQLRAHAEPDPAGGGQLRGAVQAPRGRPAAAARETLREQRTEARGAVLRGPKLDLQHQLIQLSQ